jgi:hypothetical protein
MNLAFFDFLKSKVGGSNNGHRAKPTPAAKKPESATPAPAPPTAPKVSRDDLWRQCEALAKSPRILDRFAEELKRSGVVGEERTAKLVYHQSPRLSTPSNQAK